MSNDNNENFPNPFLGMSEEEKVSEWANIGKEMEANFSERKSKSKGEGQIEELENLEERIVGIHNIDNLSDKEKEEIGKLENKYIDLLKNLDYRTFIDYKFSCDYRVNKLSLEYMQGKDVAQDAKDLSIIIDLIERADIKFPRFAEPSLIIR